MKQRIALIISALLIAALYQNCGGKQTFDESGGSSVGKQNCTLKDKSITVLSNINGAVALQLNEISATMTEWYIDDRIVRTENGRNFSYNFAASGTYKIRVDGYGSECLTPSATAEKLVNVTVISSGPPCNALPPTLTPNPTSANVNSSVTVTLSNAASFVTSSIRWSVNNVPRADRDGFATIDVSSATAGSLAVSVSANQTCNRQETSSVSIPIGAPAGVAALTSFSVQQQVSILRDSGLNAVYSVYRQPAINLVLGAANLSSASVLNLTDSCVTANCYTLNPVQTSAIDCFQEIATLAMVGTNSQTEYESFFIYCPATAAPLASATCNVGRVGRRQANEYCTNAETLTANPNPCSLNASGTCISSLNAAGLNATRAYKLYVLNQATATGNTPGSLVSCFGSVASQPTSVNWITANGADFRLMKGPLNSTCNSPTSQFAQIAPDLNVRGVVGTPPSTTTTTAPPVNCPATPLGGCDFEISPPGIHTSYCDSYGGANFQAAIESGPINNTCRASCAEGQWELLRPCGGQDF